jgi:hypothetical protein
VGRLEAAVAAETDTVGAWRTAGRSIVRRNTSAAAAPTNNHYSSAGI